MPVMDGYEATEIVRRKTDGREVPIIAITAGVFDSDRERITASGMSGYIVKPYRAHLVLEKIRQFLNIEYEYIEEPATKRDDETIIAAGDMGDIPIELLKEMQHAVLTARLDVLSGLVRKLEQNNRHHAKQLNNFMRKYDYKSLFQALHLDNEL